MSTENRQAIISPATAHKFELIGRIFSGLAHELNGPIGIAMGLSELAKEAIVAKLAGTQNSRESQFLSELTEREREVLDCMARGLSNAAIAEELFIQPRTVERHIGSIFSKMRLQPQPKAHARVQAVLAYLSDTGRLKEGSKAGEGDDSMIGAIGMMG